MASGKRESQVITLSASSVILDIEGTTSSISFVKDVLFPYVRSNLEQYLNENWDSDEFKDCIKALRDQAQQDNDNKIEGVVLIPEEGEENVLKTAVMDNIKWQMDNDRKTKSLKDLQGLIMEKGYKAGDLKGHIYNDVEQSLRSWAEQDKSVYIYSSGSVQAQKLLFGHSEKGDLLPLIKGHFDTTVGMKRDVNSYKEILKQIGSHQSETVFLTDVPEEARAAKEAGVLAILVSREGNSPLSDDDKSEFQVVTSFEDIEFEINCKKRKTCSENTVNNDNKEIVSCSLSIQEKNKPDLPQLANNIEEKQTSSEDNSVTKAKESTDVCSNADELMDVDESHAEETHNNQIKISEKEDDSLQEDSLVEMKKTANSDVEDTKAEIKDATCINDVKKENVDTMLESEKEIKIVEKENDHSHEVNSVESKNTANSDTENTNSDTKNATCIDVAKKGDNFETTVRSKKEETVQMSDSESSNKEAAHISCKNATNKVEDTNNENKGTVNSVCENKLENSNEATDVKCEGEKKVENVSENKMEVTINSHPDNLEMSVKEGESDPTCENTDKGGETKTSENSHISQKANEINKDKSLIENEEKTAEGPSISQEEKINDEKKRTAEELSVSQEEQINDNEKCLTTTTQKSQREEEISIQSNGMEESKKNISEVCNDTENKDVEVRAVLIQETVKTVTNDTNSSAESNNIISKTSSSLDDKNESLETKSITSQTSDEQKKSLCDEKQNNVSENCEKSEVVLSKTVDVIESDENHQNKLQKESNGSVQLECTNNETEVPLINEKTDKNGEVESESPAEKREDKILKTLSRNCQISNGDSKHSNGVSSPELKKDDGLTQEVVLEGKKADNSENNSVETVVEA